MQFQKKVPNSAVVELAGESQQVKVQVVVGRGGAPGGVRWAGAARAHWRHLAAGRGTAPRVGPPAPFYIMIWQ